MGKAYEPVTSTFHLEQIDFNNDLDELENKLIDREFHECLVSVHLQYFVSFLKV